MPPELFDTGLTPMEVIDKHTHFGNSSYPTSIQPTYHYSSVSDNDILSASRSSGVLGPYSLADSPTRGVVGPIDAPDPAVGMRDRILSVVSDMSDRDTGHLRQISEVTVSAASDAGNSSPATIISPLDVSAARTTMSIPTPISPPTAGLSFEDEGDRYSSAFGGRQAHDDFSHSVVSAFEPKDQNYALQRSAGQSTEIEAW